jgi:glycosyltransferase involved in cell wall biosynthesis
VCTSALEKGKRLHLAIQALGKLGRGTLLLAGEGADRNAIVSLGQQVLGTQFGWLGALPYPELPPLYRTADVFCMPSANEPFGNVTIEAMACGRPVVATDDETRRWLLGDRGGIVVDVTSVDEHAAAIQRAYSTDWADGPRNEALRFSWDVVVKEYSRVLEQAVEESLTARITR